MTTAAGLTVADNQNSLTAGPRGPVLMQDHQLMERMAHFNRERVPERVVHAEGAGAHGRLTITHDVSRYTQKRDPATGLHDNTRQWYFWSLSPESLHHVTILFSDRGTEAAVIASTDLDFHRRDLHDAIARGGFPKWKVQVQLIHPFDLTEVWPHADYPVVDVGEFQLDRNPTNYFAEVEQAAFEPGNMPPRRGVSPRQLGHFHRADPDYGARVAAALGVPLGEVIEPGWQASDRRPGQ